MSVWPVPSQNSHFTFQRNLNNFRIFSAVKKKMTEISRALLSTLHVHADIRGKIGFLNKLSIKCYVKLFCAGFSHSAYVHCSTPTVCGSHSSQMREFTASVKHVGVCSYCICILSLLLYSTERSSGGYHHM